MRERIKELEGENRRLRRKVDKLGESADSSPDAPPCMASSEGSGFMKAMKGHAPERGVGESHLDLTMVSREGSMETLESEE